MDARVFGLYVVRIEIWGIKFTKSIKCIWTLWQWHMLTSLHYIDMQSSLLVRKHCIPIRICYVYPSFVLAERPKVVWKCGNDAMGCCDQFSTLIESLNSAFEFGLVFHLVQR